MNELNHNLKNAGYNPIAQYGGITVQFPDVAIAIGVDPDNKDLFMVNIQEDKDFGSTHKSLDDQSSSDIMKLCKSYASVVPTTSTASS